MHDNKTFFYYFLFDNTLSVACYLPLKANFVRSFGRPPLSPVTPQLITMHNSLKQVTIIRPINFASALHGSIEYRRSCI